MGKSFQKEKLLVQVKSNKTIKHKGKKYWLVSLDIRNVRDIPNE